MGDQKSVLEMKGILKDYPGVRAVNYANLELAPGKCTRWWVRMEPANRR